MGGLAGTMLISQAGRADADERGRDHGTEDRAGEQEGAALLVDALDEGLPTPERLARLNELRDSLGTAAFFAGRMPAPVPDYGP